MKTKMAILIGRLDNPDRLPDIQFSIGGDITTARQTAVYLAANMKDGFKVALQGDGFPSVYIDSGQPLTASEYAAIHDGEGGNYASK